MLAIVSIATGVAVSANGYGVTYGPGAGGFNGLGLRGAQVNGAANYWQPKPSSDLMSQGKTNAAVEAAACNGNYFGNACEQRICPYGLSINTSPYLKNGMTSRTSIDDNIFAPTSRLDECNLVNGECDQTQFLGDPDKFLGTHTYSECSGKGLCDRETGMCECFDGYTGVGCRYSTCPNDCSGHGMCRQNAKANTDYDTPGSSMFHGKQYWDAHMTMRCVCDRGFEGYDCADRICPYGDDVLTTCLVEGAHDVQDIELAFGAAMSTFDEHSQFFTLTYEDAYNGVYTTRPIGIVDDDPDATAQKTQIALESLPNQALPSVQVSGVQAGDTITLSVTFSDSTNSGMQKDLGCGVRLQDETCSNIGGQQPYIDSQLADGDLTCTNLGHQNTDPDEFEENVVCGNRGICDKSTGQCACFDGHTGAACDTYSVYV